MDKPRKKDFGFQMKPLITWDIDAYFSLFEKWKTEYKIAIMAYREAKKVVDKIRLEKPTPAACGYNSPRKKDWDKYGYEKALKKWKQRPLAKTNGGRPPKKPIHPSWTDYVAHFDPADPERSQGAFCRWSGIRPSSLSAAKNKPISNKIELKLSEWIEELAKTKDNEQQQ